MTAGTGAQKGFTLAEVMVALAVFSIAAMALLNAHTQGIASVADLESRVLAGIVADNVLAEAMTGPAPETGVRRGQVALGGRDWLWTLRTSPTAEPTLHRLSVSVRAAGPDGQVLAGVDAFRRRP